MNQLTLEQETMIRDLAAEKGYNPDKAIDTISNFFNTVGNIVRSIRAAIDYLKDRLSPLIEAYKQYRHEQNVKFFKKKKSQRKNWSKWKKRKR